jgi:hypothetical protein
MGLIYFNLMHQRMRIHYLTCSGRESHQNTAALHIEGLQCRPGIVLMLKIVFSIIVADRSASTFKQIWMQGFYPVFWIRIRIRIKMVTLVSDLDPQE